MNRPTDKQCISAYRNHKHLKLAANEIGMKWQTLYVRLRQLNEPVTGDKLRYGSMSDKVGAKTEILFNDIVPYAENQNMVKAQAKCDFIVKGMKVEIKGAYPKKSNKGTNLRRWSFSLKKQESLAEVFVLFAFYDTSDINHVFLIPGEIARNYQTISISESGSSKWMEYKIEVDEIKEFFDSF